MLRILQDGWIERVGAEKPINVDVRIVAATNRDLAAMVAQGRFREDLWYRIAVFPIVLPPLRERREDIGSLALHFAQRAATRFGLAPVAPTAEDLALLAAYAWPGNVRELAAVIDRAAILGDGKRLDMAVALGVTPGASSALRAGSSPPGSAGRRDRRAAGSGHVPAYRSRAARDRRPDRRPRRRRRGVANQSPHPPRPDAQVGHRLGRLPRVGPGMRLIYKLYPVSLWFFCLLFWAIGLCLTVYLFRARWTLFLWPFPSAVFGWVSAGILVRRFPRLRFVNEAEIDGLGYVHQPLDVLIPFLLTGFAFAVAAMFH